MSALSPQQVAALPSLAKQNAADFYNKSVLVRADLNVPLDDRGRVCDASRITAAIPTLKWLIEAGAKVWLTSHLGKPKGYDDKLSLHAIIPYLEKALNLRVVWHPTWPNNPPKLQPGTLALAENLRFFEGECAGDDALARAMMEDCDVFVQDAFGCAHRPHTSIKLLPQYAKKSFAGRLLTQEVTTLSNVMEDIQRPFVALIGGAKMATKLPLLTSLAPLADTLLIGGCLASTFLAAKGYNVGQSLYEANWVDQAKALLEKYPNRFVLPTDVVVGKTIDSPQGQTVPVTNVASKSAIFDMGPESQKYFADVISKARLVVWNGPVGAFEHQPFSAGTAAMANAMASTSAYTLLGGGETLSAFSQFAKNGQVSYSCTGGGAFLAFFQENGLPGVEALLDK